MLQIPQEMMKSSQRFEEAGRAMTQEIANEIDWATAAGNFKSGHILQWHWLALLNLRFRRSNKLTKLNASSAHNV